MESLEDIKNRDTIKKLKKRLKSFYSYDYYYYGQGRERKLMK